MKKRKPDLSPIESAWWAGNGAIVEIWVVRGVAVDILTNSQRLLFVCSDCCVIRANID
jgi:hypothetical protein